eukprot:5598727-Prymnesium_polylepis.1
MVKGWSKDGQGMVKGWSREWRQKSERSPQSGQRAVDLQGVRDHNSALVADLIITELQLGQRAVDLQGLCDRDSAL